MVRFFGNKVFQAYFLFVALIFLLSFVTYTNLNSVTISAFDKVITKRVSNITVKEFLSITGIMKKAEEINAKVIDNAGELTDKGNYLVCNVKLDKRIVEDTSIRVNFIEVQELSLETSLPFKVRIKKTNDLLPGQKRIVKKGTKGIKKLTYRITMKDGSLVERKQIACKTLCEPVDQVIEEGVSFVQVSRGRKTDIKQLASKSTYVFRSTAYTHTGYRTATGIKPRYGVVAVDPRVIALGTKLYIEGYGYAVAADTGGAIKGNKIDVFFESRGEAIQWGRRTVKVTILG